jgi:Flp pilus assembly protein TadG
VRHHVPERGSATAELAVALPALVLVLGVALAAVVLGLDQVRCVDAARVAARSVARGDDLATARTRAGAAAPPGAQVVIETSAGTVRVSVTGGLPERLAGWTGLPTPGAVAVAALEGEP